MRKIFVLGVFLFAASFAFSEPVSFGLLASWAPLEENYQSVSFLGTPETADYTFETLGVRAFADLTYVEASIGYRAAVTQLSTAVTISGTSIPTVTTSYSINLIDLRLVGKYPFYFASFRVFPLAGVAKDSCLSGSGNGTAFTSDQINSASPWYVLAGVGGDYRINKQLYVRTELTAAYNLTSEQSSSFYTGATYQSSTGWQVQLAAGIGYSLD